MRGDGAEAASPETAAVQVHREPNHLKGGDGAAFLVAGMGQAGVRQIEGRVDLALRHRGEGWVDDQQLAAHALGQAAPGALVGLLFDVLEVARKCPPLCQTVLVRGQLQDLPVPVPGRQCFPRLEQGCLGYCAQRPKGHAAIQQTGDLLQGQLTHAVDQQVGATVDEDRGLELIGPVVVVGDPAQRCLDTAEDDRSLRIELLENPRVHRGRVVRPKARLPARCVRVRRAPPPRGGIVVDHRVHATRGDAEEKPRGAQLSEVAQVIPPVGLRHDGHSQPQRFQEAPDDRVPEGRMVDVRLTGDDDDVQPIPAAGHDFLRCRGEPVGHRRRVGQHVLGSGYGV